MTIIICPNCKREKEAKAHGLCTMCYSREWRKTENGKAQSKNYYLKNKEKIKKKVRAYNQRPEIKLRRKELEKNEFRKYKHRECEKRRRIRPEVAKQKKEHYYKVYRTEHGRESYKMRALRRRARKKNANGSHTIEQWLEIRNRSPMCQMCGRFVECERLSRDHIIPLSKGGGDNIENIQALCRSCNSMKSNKVYGGY